MQIAQKFQRTFYQIIKADTNLPPIHINLQKDAKYPFILMQLEKLVNLSGLRFEQHQVEFSISIYIRSNEQERLTNIIEKIDQHLVSNELKTLIISIRKLDCQWVNGHDLLSTKLSVRYKALLQHKEEA